MNYDLDRFIKMQERDFDKAYNEIKNGHKVTHWIWYIFPQVKGLGFSYNSEFYGIDGLEEAKAYLNNKYLKDNLIKISEALLNLDSSDPLDVMGYPDDLKLFSSMTLFNEADPTIDVFSKVLDKYYDGDRDEKTLNILHNNI